jgi:DNA mismatch repair protein MSH6
LRLLRSCVGVDCQWTALKEGKEFLRSEDAKDEVVKLFKEAAKGKKGEGEMEVDEEEEVEGEVAVPENIKAMYDKPVAMSALGGMIWCVSPFSPFPPFSN